MPLGDELAALAVQHPEMVAVEGDVGPLRRFLGSLPGRQCPGVARAHVKQPVRGQDLLAVQTAFLLQHQAEAREIAKRGAESGRGETVPARIDRDQRVMLGAQPGPDALGERLLPVPSFQPRDDPAERFGVARVVQAGFAMCPGLLYRLQKLERVRIRKIGGPRLKTAGPGIEVHL